MRYYPDAKQRLRTIKAEQGLWHSSSCGYCVGRYLDIAVIANQELLEVPREHHILQTGGAAAVHCGERTATEQVWYPCPPKKDIKHKSKKKPPGVLLKWPTMPRFATFKTNVSLTQIELFFFWGGVKGFATLDITTRATPPTKAFLNQNGDKVDLFNKPICIN